MPLPDYCTSTEAQLHLPDGNWGTGYDALLATLISRASRAIDGFLKRKPGTFAVATDATYYLDGNGRRELWIPELAALPTTVAVAETALIDTPVGTGGTYTTWGVGDYFAWPYNALDEGVPFLRLDVNLLTGTKAAWYSFPRSVKITGKWGFATAVPDEIKEAAIIQTVRWFKRGQQAFQDVGAIAELGQLQYVKKLDPDIAAILEVAKFQRVTV